MKIDFTATSEQHGVVEYYNVRGNSVRSYPLSQLEEWVIKNELHITQGYESKGGTGMISDPNTDFKLIDIEHDVADVLDNSWIELTAMFYNAMNPTEFKSQNTPNQKHV